METLERLNISIDRKWIVREQKKSVSLSLVWHLQEFDRSKYEPEFLPHFSLINNDREAEMPSRLRFTLIPDDQGKVEAILQLAESEIAHTKLYFDFGRRPAFTLDLQDFINYFPEEPNAPNKTPQ